MEYLFIQRPEDRDQVLAFLSEFNKNSKVELIENYNKAVEIGIIGSRVQAQRLIALNITFNKVFGSSPIQIVNNMIIRLNDKIELTENNWNYIKQNG